MYVPFFDGRRRMRAMGMDVIGKSTVGIVKPSRPRGVDAPSLQNTGVGQV
jgi:hypothetical protein